MKSGWVAGVKSLVGWTQAAEGIGDETNVPQQPPVPEEVDPSAYALPDHELEEPTDTLAALLLLRAQFPTTQVTQPTATGSKPRKSAVFTGGNRSRCR